MAGELTPEFDELADAAVAGLKALDEYMRTVEAKGKDKRARQEAFDSQAQRVLNEHDRLVKIVGHIRDV